MAGTMSGGKAAALTNKIRYGTDYYTRIGHLGGSAPKTKPSGFAADRELASIAGRFGGQIGRRGSRKLDDIRQRQIRKAYEELLAIHMKAKREREAYTVA
ncbi:MAG: hypothetical protein KGL39_47030 [Patescibacteria group bacterium]|nr:hypothetical protein [Patescibacteria group bacterium]